MSEIDLHPPSEEERAGWPASVIAPLETPFGGARAIQSVGGAQGPFRPGVPVLWDWAPHDIAMCLDLVGETPSAVAGPAYAAKIRPTVRAKFGPWI